MVYVWMVVGDNQISDCLWAGVLCEARDRINAKAHTTHLVLAIVLALGAADAEDRRRLGADSIDALEAGSGWDVCLRANVLVGSETGSASKGVSDRHCGYVLCWNGKMLESGDGSSEVSSSYQMECRRKR
jgi:hypothetical protein